MRRAAVVLLGFIFLTVTLVVTVLMASEEDVPEDEEGQEEQTEEPEVVNLIIKTTYAAAEPDQGEDLEEESYMDELELLAQVVEAEAGNQDLTGKRLVVDVVLNRVDSPLYPNTITEVLEQEGQFTCMSNGAVERAGWNMQQSDYDAVLLELEKRLDYDIFFFTAGEYNPTGRPAYIHGDHYFNYLD